MAQGSSGSGAASPLDQATRQRVLGSILRLCAANDEIRSGFRKNALSLLRDSLGWSDTMTEEHLIEVLRQRAAQFQAAATETDIPTLVDLAAQARSAAGPGDPEK